MHLKAVSGHLSPMLVVFCCSSCVNGKHCRPRTSKEVEFGVQKDLVQIA